MADFTIPITIPDEKLSTFIDALRRNYGANDDGSDKTPAELKVNVKTSVTRMLRKIYILHLQAERDILGTDDLGAT